MTHKNQLSPIQEAVAREVAQEQEEISSRVEKNKKEIEYETHGFWGISHPSGDSRRVMTDLCVWKEGAIRRFVNAAYPGGTFSWADKWQLFHGQGHRAVPVVIHWKEEEEEEEEEEL